MQPENTLKPKGLNGAEIARASELVNYQDGSIVSREIVKKATGNVTIFAFDEGQGLSTFRRPGVPSQQFLSAEFTTSSVLY